MQNTLSYEFYTASRDEMKKLIACIAECINEHLILNGTQTPLVIVINGSEDAGKTLFWDVIRMALLPHATLDPHNSRKTQDQLIGTNRDYETWEGLHEATNSELRIFCANALDVTGRIPNVLTSPKEVQKALGDIILVNNTNSSPYLKTAHLQPDLIAYASMTDQAKENWRRKTYINIPEDSKLQTLQPLYQAQRFRM